MQNADLHDLKSVHEKITSTTASFDAVLKSIKLTKNKGIYVQIHTVVNSLNHTNLIELSRIIDWKCSNKTKN